MGRRDRRKAEARRRLMSAARNIVAEAGIHRLRIVDVTRRADLGFGTFYTYFDTKDALVEAVVAEALGSLASTIGSAARAASDPAEAAALSYSRFLQFASSEQELARVLVALDQADNRFEEAVRPWAIETLERGRQSGRFAIADVELCLSTVAASALAAIRGILSGRFPAGSATESIGAEMMLRAFGLDREEARDIAYRGTTTLPSGQPS